MTTIRQSPNDLLAALPLVDFELLCARLKPVDLRFGQVLVEAGGPLKLVYFPHDGIISSMVSLGQGEAIEVAMVGCDGVFGGSAALFGGTSPTAAVVRYPGKASVIDVAHFRTVAELSAPLRAALMQKQCIQTMQAEQTVACNASHSVEARLCRRLLQSRELSGSDRLPLTQDMMAQMLAVQRNTISLVAHALQHAGVIRYSRGHLEITNLDGLIRRSCECYDADHAHLSNASVSRGDPRQRVRNRGDHRMADQRSPS
ncbi:MAG: Crp/Fnr family transcriptional regulator [Rhodopseudomonas sp.]|uniref:Crp/Fnr family transcriptional regulator n=1 Tax=Rhodopseudomonas sp. TaxID=1078 RepID=UPI0017D82F63|nr:Crp/Fnr family transcriptional regulator [Rhodopseudomonas sp.]NVN88751.1 Crp/Fnr family transcriptional regulator [Rhodopseudomonas sp.]